MDPGTEPKTARASVTDETIVQIKAMITSGDFPPGGRLPTERLLAGELGVSRNSLREAIRALTLVGVLESRQGDGTYVTSLAPGLLLDAFSMFVELSADATVVDVLAVRRVLESEAAARAAVRITAEQLEALEACLVEMRLDPQRGEAEVDEVVAADVRFHRIMCQAAGNPVLGALIESLSSRTIRARVWRGHKEQGVFARVLAEHEAILAALTDRDPTRAAACAAAHVAAVEAFLRIRTPDFRGSP